MTGLISLTTLGELKSHGYRLFGHCGRLSCGRGRELDIDNLIKRYGANYSIIGDTRIKRALVCTGCGHKGGSLTIAGPNLPKP